MMIIAFREVIQCSCRTVCMLFLHTPLLPDFAYFLKNLLVPVPCEGVPVYPSHTADSTCLQCASNHLVLIVEVCILRYMLQTIIYEYEPNQTSDYAVNLGLIMSKTSFNGCFNVLTGHCMLSRKRVDHGCYQPLYPDVQSNLLKRPPPMTGHLLCKATFMKNHVC